MKALWKPVRVETASSTAVTFKIKMGTHLETKKRDWLRLLEEYKGVLSPIHVKLRIKKI